MSRTSYWRVRVFYFHPYCIRVLYIDIESIIWYYIRVSTVGHNSHKPKFTMKHILSVIVALSFLLTFGHAGVEVLHFDASKPNSDGTYNAVDSKGNKVLVDAWNSRSYLAPKNTSGYNPALIYGAGILTGAVFAGIFMYTNRKQIGNYRR